MLALPETNASYWRNVYTSSLYPKLKGDLSVDAVIVGGGITGLTTAYLLKQSGLRVAVIEKDTVGGGTTGRTTGKVTSQHNLIYDDFLKRLGKETASIYGLANETAIKKVEDIVKAEKIDCDWERDAHYVYTTKSQPEQIKRFQAEARAAAQCDLPATFERTTPLPFKVTAAVKFANQGKIHAQKYVLGLAKAVHGKGSYVFEHSHAIGIRDGTQCRVRTSGGRVFAKHIVIATNVPTLPLLARGAYCILEYPMESYIVLGQPRRKLKGMYISPDSDSYSLLPFKHGSSDILLVGGESHISGLRGNTTNHYNKLADYAWQHFGVPEIDFHWSDRDYLSYDGPPLAGRAYPWSKNLYVASAFRKWGLSNGTVSAMIIHDLINGRPNPWADVYSPQRSGPVKSIPRVAGKYIFKR